MRFQNKLIINGAVVDYIEYEDGWIKSTYTGFYFKHPSSLIFHWNSILEKQGGEAATA